MLTTSRLLHPGPQFAGLGLGRPGSPFCETRLGSFFNQTCATEEKQTSILSCVSSVLQSRNDSLSCEAPLAHESPKSFTVTIPFNMQFARSTLRVPHRQICVLHALSGRQGLSWCWAVWSSTPCHGLRPAS